MQVGEIHDKSTHTVENNVLRYRFTNRSWFRIAPFLISGRNRLHIFTC